MGGARGGGGGRGAFAGGGGVREGWLGGCPRGAIWRVPAPQGPAMVHRKLPLPPLALPLAILPC